MKLLGITAVALAFLTLPVGATPIFYSTNGTTSPTYNSGFSWDASAVIAGSVVSVGMQFTSGLTGTVASIVAPLSGNVADVTFVLRTDVSNIAGAVIDTFTFHTVDATIQLLSAPSTANASLSSGTVYWLEMLAPTPSITVQSASWYYSASPVVTGLVEVENPVPSVLTSQTISGFAVLGADAPEPATIGLAGIAIPLVAALYRRRLRMLRASAATSS